MAVTPKQLVTAATQALNDGKAVDITVLDVRKLTSMADYMVIATGRSSRQVQALAGHVADAARALKQKPIGVEGEETSEWVLVDLGDVIVHVMQAETREFYQLEKLWEPLPRSRKSRVSAELEA
ncbi:MAG: ribosome silencing factor [Gammaproteobacteria bacterium]|nr:ribosome silencing factor [Gammaproteobacteria bacterium]